MDKRPSLHSCCRHELHWNVHNVPSFAQAAEPFRFPLGDWHWQLPMAYPILLRHRARSRQGGKGEEIDLVLLKTTGQCCRMWYVFVASQKCALALECRTCQIPSDTFCPVLTKFLQIFFTEAQKMQYLYLRFLVFLQHSVLLFCNGTTALPCRASLDLWFH